MFKRLMEIKYTLYFQNRLEDIFAESDYVLRYEKGNFQAGYCLLKQTHVAVVNKYYTTEGKINALLEILRTVSLDTDRMCEKNLKLYRDILQSGKSKGED
jgi:hypothetical protein